MALALPQAESWAHTHNHEADKQPKHPVATTVSATVPFETRAEGILVTEENFHLLRHAGSFQELRDFRVAASKMSMRDADESVAPSTSVQLQIIPENAFVFDMGFPSVRKEMDAYSKMLQNFAAALDGRRGGGPVTSRAGAPAVGPGLLAEAQMRGQRFTDVMRLARQRVRVVAQMQKCEHEARGMLPLIELRMQEAREADGAGICLREGEGLALDGKKKNMKQDQVPQKRTWDLPPMDGRKSSHQRRATSTSSFPTSAPSSAASTSSSASATTPKHHETKRSAALDEEEHSEKSKSRRELLRLRNMKESLTSLRGVKDTFRALEIKHFRLVCEFLVPKFDAKLMTNLHPTDSSSSSSTSAPTATLCANCAPLTIEICTAGGELCTRRKAADLVREARAVIGRNFADAEATQNVREGLERSKAEAHPYRAKRYLEERGRGGEDVDVSRRRKAPTHCRVNEPWFSSPSEDGAADFAKGTFLKTNLQTLLEDTLRKSLAFRLREIYLALLRGLGEFPKKLSVALYERTGSPGLSDNDEVTGMAKVLLQTHYFRANGHAKRVTTPSSPSQWRRLVDPEAQTLSKQAWKDDYFHIHVFAARGLAATSLLRLLLVSKDHTERSARRLLLHRVATYKTERQTTAAAARQPQAGGGSDGRGTQEHEQQERYLSENAAPQRPTPRLSELLTGDLVQISLYFDERLIGGWGVIGHGENDGRAFLIPVSAESEEVFQWIRSPPENKRSHTVRLYVCVDIDNTMATGGGNCGDCDDVIVNNSASSSSSVLGFLLVHLTDTERYDYHYGDYLRRATPTYQFGIFIRAGDRTPPAELITMMSERFSQLREYAPKNADARAGNHLNRHAIAIKQLIQDYTLSGTTGSIPSRMSLSLQNVAQLLSILEDREIVGAERASWLAGVLRAVPVDSLEKVRLLLPACDVAWHRFAKAVMMEQIARAADRRNPSSALMKTDRNSVDGKQNPPTTATPQRDRPAVVEVDTARGERSWEEPFPGERERAALRERWDPTHAPRTAVSSSTGQMRGQSTGSGNKKLKKSEGSTLKTKDLGFHLSKAALRELSTGDHLTLDTATRTPSDLHLVQEEGTATSERKYSSEKSCVESVIRLKKDTSKNTRHDLHAPHLPPTRNQPAASCKGAWRFIAMDEDAARSPELDCVGKFSNLFHFLEAKVRARSLLEQEDDITSTGVDVDGEEEAGSCVEKRSGKDGGDGAAGATNANNAGAWTWVSEEGSASEAERIATSASGSDDRDQKHSTKLELSVSPPKIEQDAFHLRFTVIVESRNRKGKEQPLQQQHQQAEGVTRDDEEDDDSDTPTLAGGVDVYEDGQHAVLGLSQADREFYRGRVCDCEYHETDHRFRDGDDTTDSEASQTYYSESD